MNRLLIITLALVFLFVPKLVHAQNIEYVSSALWHNTYETEVAGNYAFCLYENGLMIYDISNPINPVVYSHLYIQEGASDLEIVGNYIYLATNRGLKIANISDIGHPELIGQWAGQRGGVSIAVTGNLVLLLEMFTLRIIDISNPTNPQLLASYALSGNGYAVAAQGSYAFLAVNYSGLETVDLSVPSNPHRESQYDALDYNMGIAVRGEYAYFENDQNGLMIFNISDPANPTLAGTEPSSFGFNITLSGDYAYIPRVSGDLLVVNIANSQNPLPVGDYQSLGSCADAAISGAIACLASQNYFEVIDISNPTQPISIANRQNAQVIGLSLYGNYAFIANDDYGIGAVDISDPQNPIQFSGAFVPFDIHCVTANGNYIYASGLGFGFSVFDASVPTNPYPVARIDTTDFITNVKAYGNYLYSNDFTFGGLKIYNAISEPPYLIYAGSYRPSNYLINSRLKMSDHWLYLTSDKFEILDIANPAIPTLIGSLDGFLQGKAIDVTEDYAYVVLDTALAIVNITDRANPHLARSIWNMHLNDVYISGNYMYLLTDNEGLCTYDISNPIDPQLAESFYTTFPLLEIQINENNLYIAALHSLLILRSNATDIEYNNTIPRKFSFSQNFPNPFNSSTSITYSLPKSGPVNFSIYNLLGQKVATLSNGIQQAGEHTIIWNAKDSPSGVYFAKLESGDETKNIKMVLLK